MFQPIAVAQRRSAIAARVLAQLNLTFRRGVPSRFDFLFGVSRRSKKICKVEFNSSFLRSPH
jgi:hypothetical protein